MIFCRVLAVAALAFAGASGCNTLFPELAGNKASDLAGHDGGADFGANLAGALLHGAVCRLTDLRTPTSCKAAASGRLVTIAETGLSTTTATDGSFSFPTVGDSATVIVSDPLGSALISRPTVSMLAGATLAGAKVHGVLLPVIDAQTYQQVELDNGIDSDSSRGALVGWAVSNSGAVVPGVVASRIASGVGPLYDSGDGTVLQASARAGSFGAIAFFDLPVGTSSFTVAPPAGSGAGGNTFTLPVRAGAVTTAALTLPPG